MKPAFIGLIGAAAVLCASTAMAQTVNANHQTLDKGVVTFVIPAK